MFDEDGWLFCCLNPSDIQFAQHFPSRFSFKLLGVMLSLALEKPCNFAFIHYNRSNW